MDIDTRPLGGGIQAVSLDDLSFTLSMVPLDPVPKVDDPNTGIDSFSLPFGSFALAA